MIYYIGSGCFGIIFFVGISYWAVNFFVKQGTERTLEQFRQQVTREAQLGIKLFKEGMCEQIVLQENKSDALAKLYATLIDLLQLGKSLTASLGKGDLDSGRRKIQGIRETADIFAASYQKQSLHFTEELCKTLDAFLAEQKDVLQLVEDNWTRTPKDAQEKEKRDAEIRQSWLKFEDRVNSVMETLRTEFRSRQPSGNVMMKWLKEAGDAAAAPAQKH